MYIHQLKAQVTLRVGLGVITLRLHLYIDIFLSID